MKEPDEYTVRLILEWDYEEPVPGYTSQLEDARKLEQMFKAEMQATKLEVLREIRAYGRQMTANTTPTARENGLVASLIKRVVQSWLRRGVHRNPSFA
jgi:hypothetical protein